MKRGISIGTVVIIGVILWWLAQRQRQVKAAPIEGVEAVSPPDQPLRVIDRAFVGERLICPQAVGMDTPYYDAKSGQWKCGPGPEASGLRRV